MGFIHFMSFRSFVVIFLNFFFYLFICVLVSTDNAIAKLYTNIVYTYMHAMYICVNACIECAYVYCFAQPIFYKFSRWDKERDS